MGQHNQENNNKRNLVEDQDFDLFFKTNLENHEVSPKPANWTRINQWRPFAFLYSFSKSHAFKIAASLLFLLTTSTVFFQLNNCIDKTPIASVAIEENPIEPITEIVPIITTEEETFVLDIETEEDEDKDVRVEIIEKEIDDYIAFLFADEDEFADVIDSVEISKSLELAEQLPLDDMFAVIPDIPKQEQEVYTILAPLETKIILPHRFVEADENIEDYLLLYEINQINTTGN